MRGRRVLAAVAGVAAVASVLTACDKPVPKITVLANKTVTQVNPRVYVFDKDHTRIGSGVTHVRAAGGSTILIDVPRTVSRQWQVSSVTFDADNKPTNIAVDGATSPIITDNHATRVVVPRATGDYFLTIVSQDGSKTGQWLVQVTPTA